ncbi:MAG TPA: PIN domain-containing protein [Terriglobales bacterium]|nr:PIN domain-containing protein [Terriglobales bacterium]
MVAEAGYVLDSSALLALLLGEPGAERVQACLPDAVVSSVNLTEATTKLLHKGAEPAAARAMLEGLRLEIVPWAEALVWASLDLCPLAWTNGLSLGDRACLALSRSLHRKALTADAAWVAVGRLARPAIAVELFRPPRRM